MKKLILTAVAGFSMQIAFAQNGAVNNANLYLKSGTLDKAKTEIDKAVVHEKTANSAKAWFTKGEVYSALVNSPLPAYKSLANNALEESIAAYDKAIALDNGGDFAKQAQEKKKALSEVIYVSAINEGVKLYNDKDLNGALQQLEKAHQANPTDTLALQNLALIAEQAEKYDVAKTNYNRLLAINYTKPNVYKRLYFINKDIDKNNAEALKVLEAGLKANPNDKDLMLEELNTYISSGRGTEAISKLENAIKVDPNNANLYNVLGEVYNQSKKTDLAEQNFKKAIAINPNDYNANYNLGVIHFNRGAELSKKYNNMDAASQRKAAATTEPQIKKHFNAALPYFETALKANPKDTGTMDTLAKVYLALGRTKDAEAMNKKSDAARQ
ncbi:MAG: hypothetical protein COW65_10195 [Cytophagales bacterium CG18_big_fil_WC_8_21_14_2_50_42_9]|nr:MAG: hypothetical protein COW65_10195 [Cytophagales bacterium CG18_big_fil_WC_8_21_14_2_50_42_9]